MELAILVSNLFIHVHEFIFIRPFEKTGPILGTSAAAREFVCSITFNSFHCIIIKLCEHVCWQNVSAKFDNQPDPMKHFGVMALELAKFAKINRSVTRIFLIVVNSFNSLG